MLTLRNGLTITEADYQPLSSFPIKWRWTDPRWNLLPPDDLATLHPLTVEKTREVRQYGVKFWGEMERGIPHLSSALFPHTVRVNVSGDAEPACLWLEEHIVQNESPVFVDYDCGIVQVSCRVFCRYWDDFCYPYGENMLIWPVSEEWALAYWREEEFVFGATASPP